MDKPTAHFTIERATHLQDETLPRALVSFTGSDAELKSIRHDIAGALRAMRYLAQKAQTQYDPDTDRGKIESISGHLRTLDLLCDELIDPLLSEGLSAGG